MTSSPAFALLHGGGQGGWVWAETRAALEARGARVLVLDAPGCGTKRERNCSEMDVDATAAELIADIRAEGLSEVTLVGHSLAGAVMPRMAEAGPGLFRRLVYVSCTAPPTGKSFLELMGAGLHGMREDEVGWPVDPMENTPEVRWRAMLCTDMDEDQAFAFLARLGWDHWPSDMFVRKDWRYDHLAANPSAYILCERDNALPAAWQERFAERLQADRILRVDVGHQVMNTHPELLADLLMDEAARA